MLGMFDVIFCRNVLIYLDDNTKRRIYSQFRQMLPNDGYLIMGACENLNMLTDKFDSIRMERSIVYKCR